MPSCELMQQMIISNTSNLQNKVGILNFNFAVRYERIVCTSQLFKTLKNIFYRCDSHHLSSIAGYGWVGKVDLCGKGGSIDDLSIN